MESTSVDGENPLAKRRDKVYQSVPIPERVSMMSNMTEDAFGLSQNSQLARDKPKSRFGWLRNKHIGRRTGKDVRRNKQIRVHKNGREIFDDYLSESECESFLSGSSTCKRRSAKIDLLLTKEDLIYDHSQENQTGTRITLGDLTENTAGKTLNGSIKQSIHNGDTDINYDVEHEHIDNILDRNESRRTISRSSVKKDSKDKENKTSRTDLPHRDNTADKSDDAEESDRETCLEDDPGTGDEGFDEAAEDDDRDTHSDKTEDVDDDDVGDGDNSEHSDRESEHEGEEDNIDVSDVENDDSVDGDHVDDVDDGENDVIEDEYDDVNDDEEINEDNKGDKDDRGHISGSRRVSEHGHNAAAQHDTVGEKSSNKTNNGSHVKSQKRIQQSQQKSQQRGKVNKDVENADDVDNNVALDNKEVSDLDEPEAQNDENEKTGLSGGKSQKSISALDVAGNRSGSLTKKTDALGSGSDVHFNRSKKRLSYSALEASERKAKARENKVKEANLELAKEGPHDQVRMNQTTDKSDKETNIKKQDKQLDNSMEEQNVVGEEDNDFLCLSVRSVHKRSDDRHDRSEDEETDITIIDDIKTNKNKSTLVSRKNKSQNVGKLKDTDSSLKTKKNKSEKKKVSKTVDKKNKVVPKKQTQSDKGKTSLQRSSKVNRRLADELVDYLVSDSDQEREDVDNEDVPPNDEDIDYPGDVHNESDVSDDNTHSQANKNTSHTSKRKSTSTLTDNNKSRTNKRKGSSVTENSVVSPPKQSKKQQKRVESSSDAFNFVNGKNLKTYSRQKPSNRKSSTEESSDDWSKVTRGNKKKTNKQTSKTNKRRGSGSTNSSHDDRSPAANIKTPQPNSRHVSTNFESGVSMRVSRRSDVLETISSGPHRRESEVCVEMEPSKGLTPCISKRGQSRKGKGRRVTICPEENQHHPLSDDETSFEIRKKKAKGRKSRSLPGVDTPLPSYESTPLHIHECTTTETPATISKLPKGYSELPVEIENRLIYPEPAPDGLRRSKRVRLKPVAEYKNEKIIWKYEPGVGEVMVGVQPSMETVYIKKQEIKRKKRQIKVALKKATEGTRSKKNKRKLSVHVDVPEDLEPQDSQFVTVMNPITREVDELDCVAYGDSEKVGPTGEAAKFSDPYHIHCVAYGDSEKVGPTGDPAKFSDPYHIRVYFDQPCMSSGMIELKPTASKEPSIVGGQAMYEQFIVQEGKVLVKIQNSAVLLGPEDSFFVPCGNVYSITNMRNDTAKLFYHVHKNTS